MEEICRKCPEYTQLHTAVLNEDKNLPQELKKYEKMLPEFTTLGPVIMLQKRVVIPQELRPNVLSHLHSSHAGTQVMIARAVQSVYWPGFRTDIAAVRDRCLSCHKFAPSNPSLPLISEPDLPDHPFQIICSDFMEWNGHTYLIIVDKYSNWVSIFKLQKDDSKCLIQVLRQYFSTFGVAQVLCTDGAPVYTSSDMKKFCETWGVTQRISSAYNPSANKRAEVGVKSAKRIIRDNVGPNGSLNTNKVVQALLAHRNGPDPTTKVSPAQIVFGRSIQDLIPQHSYVPDKPWIELAKAREKSFLRRHYLKAENDIHHSKLPALSIGDSVYIQDQTGQTPTRWSKSGVVIECLPFHSYLVKVDGSRHVTKRNRKFLKKFVPFSESLADSTPDDQKPRRSPRLNVSKPCPTEASVTAYDALVDTLVDLPLTTLVASMSLNLPAPSTLLPSGFSTPCGASLVPSREGQTGAWNTEGANS